MVRLPWLWSSPSCCGRGQSSCPARGKDAPLRWHVSAREHTCLHVRLLLRGLSGCLQRIALLMGPVVCATGRDFSWHPAECNIPSEWDALCWALWLCAEPGAFSFPVPVKVKKWRKNVAVCYRGREVKRAGNLHHVHFPLAPGRCSFRIRDLRRQS